MKVEKPVILFDGVCNLCNQAVTFVIKHDVNGKFMFASLQSETGQKLLSRFNLPLNDFESFILVEGEKYYSKSTAGLRVIKQFGGVWPLLYSLIIIPPFIRNLVYEFISRNRYKWFGQKEACMLPTPELRSRFLL